MIIIGLDQSSGSKSKFGVCVYDATRKEILEVHGLTTDIKSPAWRRIRDIVATLKQRILITHETAEVRVESTVMRGKGGETLQRVVGAVISQLGNGHDFREVHNGSLKKWATGYGGAEKAQVAEALKARVNVEFLPTLLRLIEEQAWDEIDSVALALYEGDMG